jgi:hypothetical protein
VRQRKHSRFSTTQVPAGGRPDPGLTQIDVLKHVSANKDRSEMVENFRFFTVTKTTAIVGHGKGEFQFLTKSRQKIMVRAIIFLGVSDHGDHFGILHKVSFSERIPYMVNFAGPQVGRPDLCVGKPDKWA